MRTISPVIVFGEQIPDKKLRAKKRLALFVENNWKDLVQSHRSHFNQFSNFSGQILVTSTTLKSKPNIFLFNI
jgi:hypothetical protein